MDGTILRFGELKASGGMIEQVKGFSYSAFALLGSNMLLTARDNTGEDNAGQVDTRADEKTQKSWWRVSLASPKVRGPEPAR